MKPLFSGAGQFFKDQRPVLVRLFIMVLATCIPICALHGLAKGWTVLETVMIYLATALTFCLLQLMILLGIFLFYACRYALWYRAAGQEGTDTACRRFLDNHLVLEARWFFSDQTINRVLKERSFLSC